jgi:hypothetical protein
MPTQNIPNFLVNSASQRREIVSHKIGQTIHATCIVMQFETVLSNYVRNIKTRVSLQSSLAKYVTSTKDATMGHVGLIADIRVT